MMIPAILILLVVAVIITLTLGCCCFALAWSRTEAENAQLRRNRVGRALGIQVEEQR